jgi:glycerophosphoryl diester phosphodiesterase
MTRRTSTRLLVVVLLAAGAGALTAQPAPVDVDLFGHRGFTRDAPENSIAALEAAAALGLAGGEVDLRTTRDNAIVLMHDETVERTTTGAGAVSSLTAAEIAALSLEKPDGTVTTERVPSFDDLVAFMRRHPTFRVAFDAKAVDLPAVGGRIVAEGLHDRVIFFIDDVKAVERARAVKRLDRRLRISVDLKEWWKIEGLPAFARRALDADALFASEYFFPRWGFAEARDAGAEVQVYIGGDHDLPARLRRAVSLGADVVSTDRPDLLAPMVRH